MQLSPPFSGFGLLHSRMRSLVPPPHVTLHVDHALHGLQTPFTVDKNVFRIYSSEAEVNGDEAY